MFSLNLSAENSHTGSVRNRADEWGRPTESLCAFFIILRAAGLFAAVLLSADCFAVSPSLPQHKSRQAVPANHREIAGGDVALHVAWFTPTCMTVHPHTHQRMRANGKIVERAQRRRQDGTRASVTVPA